MRERRVGDDEKPITVEEFRGELIPIFEWLNSKSMSNKEGEVLRSMHFLQPV